MPAQLSLPCSLPGVANKDGRVDLRFYPGDDTSDGIVVLLNTGKAFEVHSREVKQVE